MTDREYILQICKDAKNASSSIRSLNTKKKNRVLETLADRLLSEKSTIISENSKDMKSGQEKKLTPALLDRLELTEKRLESLAQSVLEIRNLPDPVGEVTRGTTLPNGIELLTKRVPMGVVMVIYESRPNVTIDVGALSFKSGNACILRGGSEAIHSNLVLAEMFQKSLEEEGLNKAAVSVVEKTDRSLMVPFLQESSFIDLVVPRGGEGLIQFVSENSKIPVVKHDKGVCNLYIDKDADPKKAVDIAINSKTHRPGVCNAIENIIIHNQYPQRIELLEALQAKGVELLLDGALSSLVKGAKRATDEDYAEEFLDLRLSGKGVGSLEEAIDFIRKYSSGHTEAIVSENESTIQDFLSELDSAGLFVNCSTRFHDGGEYGLGAEVGISTGKLHVRGPMGLVHLTTTTTYLRGNGQVR